MVQIEFNKPNDYQFCFDHLGSSEAPHVIGTTANESTPTMTSRFRQHKHPCRGCEHSAKLRRRPLEKHRQADFHVDVMGPGNPFPKDIDELLIDRAEQIHRFNPQTTQSRTPAGLESWTAAWSPDGRYFAWSQGSRKVKLVPWNRQNHGPIFNNNIQGGGQVLDAGDLIISLAFGSSSDQSHPYSMKLNWYRYQKFDNLVLATGLRNGRIRTWEVQTGHLQLELVDHIDQIQDIKFSPDGSLRLVSASRDKTLKVWHLDDDGNMSHTLKASNQPVNGCCWSPDSKLLCAVGDAKVVQLWDMEKYKFVGRLEGHHHNVVSCDFSPDGSLLATASYDTTVIVWHPLSRHILIKLLHLHPVPSPIFAGGDNGSFVRSVSFSHNGHIATVCDDQYVRFWSLFSPTVPQQVCKEEKPLCCSYSPDGKVLAVGTRNGTVSTWHCQNFVPSLQDLCRMTVIRSIPSNHFNKLKLPPRLQDFLQFNIRPVLLN